LLTSPLEAGEMAAEDQGLVKRYPAGAAPHKVRFARKTLSCCGKGNLCMANIDGECAAILGNAP